MRPAWLKTVLKTGAVETIPPHSTLGVQVPYAMEEITDMGCRQKRG
jgi:hypothetical protein